MLIWATYPSSRTAAEMSGGCVNIVQMATHIDDQLLSTTGPMAVRALSAAAAKCASITS